MPNKQDIAWFKSEFGSKIERAVAGTPFSVDLLTAIACQETGYLWQKIRKAQGMTTSRLLELCVGDTIGAPKRKAFPKDRAELESLPEGGRMFEIARQALLDIAPYNKAYANAARKPDAFCRGFGIFQYDLQFFKIEPDYFLEKRYADFDQCLKKVVGELTAAQRRMGAEWRAKTSLPDLEQAHVAIAYNTGSFKPELGLKQGFGGNYGEEVHNYLLLSKSAGAAPAQPTLAENLGSATITLPSAGDLYLVKVTTTPLNLRTRPDIQSKIKAKLQNNHQVRLLNPEVVNGYRQVTTIVDGKKLRGFAHQNFLTKAPPTGSTIA